MRRKDRRNEHNVVRWAKLFGGTMLTVCIICSPWWLNTEKCAPYTARVSMLSAQAGTELPRRIEALAAYVTAAEPAENEAGEEAVTAAESVTTAVTTETTAAATTTTETLREGKLPVREVHLSDAKLASGSVRVLNSTDYSVSIDDVLAKKPMCKIRLNAGYQVLIIHTHTTECYAENDSTEYDPEYSPRTTDKHQNVIAVGDVIAEKLEAVGIHTLHVTTAHDYPQYNGSYDRAAETIKDYLERYPSIEMVIDVHRDAMTQDDGTKLKPTAMINGKKAAQVMIITGCDAGGKLDFPDWQYNLRMAMQLQRRLSEDYEGLMRPLYFAPYRYNMNLTPNSLLIEFGTDVNTLDEARYAAGMVGEGLAKVLLQYTVE